MIVCVSVTLIYGVAAEGAPSGWKGTLFERWSPSAPPARPSCGCC